MNKCTLCCTLSVIKWHRFLVACFFRVPPLLLYLPSNEVPPPPPQFEKSGNATGGELMRLITSFTVYMHIYIKQEMAVKIIAVICHCVGAMFDKLQHHTWTAFKLTEQG